MRQLSGDITILEGNNELNVQMTPITLPERIGSFTLYVTNARVDATRWRALYSDRSHTDNRYLHTWHSILSNFIIINVDLNHCRVHVTQRKDGILTGVRHGPFSGLVHGAAYILDLVTGELVEGGEPQPVPPPPVTTRLFGHVTDADTGAPIVTEWGTVYQDKGVKTWKYDFATDSHGYYLIDNMIPDADLTQMVIYADGYKTYTNENIPISEGDNQLNVRMVPE